MGVKEVSRERFTESGRSCTCAFKKNIKNVPANACNKCKQTCTHKALMDQASSLITERLCAAGDSFAV